MQRLPMAALLAMAVLCAAHPGQAARGKRSAQFASDCAEYSQVKVNDGLRFELRNTCSYPMSCNLSWEVRCAGGRASPGERSTLLELPAGGTASAAAYASACAPHGWSISNVRWRCDKREAPTSSDM